MFPRLCSGSWSHISCMSYISIHSPRVICAFVLSRFSRPRPPPTESPANHANLLISCAFAPRLARLGTSCGLPVQDSIFFLIFPNEPIPATMAPDMKLDPKYDTDIDYPSSSPEVKSGHPGHTTPEQDAQVFQLRMQLEQAGYKERLDTLTMVCWPKEVPGAPGID